MQAAAPSPPTTPSGSLVLVVGSANADVVLQVERIPGPGETLLADALQIHSGGKGANQAVAAARLGADVAFIGAVGEDDLGGLVLRGLRESGVDLRGLSFVPEPTGQAFITVDRSGENSIVVSPGANQRVDASLVLGHPDLLRNAAVLVLQGEVPVATIEAAAGATTARLVLNLAPVVPVGRAVIARADPLVVNEHEGPLVLALLGTQAVPEGDEAVALALLDAGVRSVVMTLGAEGALVAQDGAVRRTAAPRATAVDTTGAGDAFVGALSARLAEGASLDEAVALAVRVGSYAVGRAGAQPSYPRLADLGGDTV